MILVGLPGAGKSTLAPLVAGMLECPSCDLDQMIVARTSTSIEDLFAREGEARFREYERAAMRAALAGPPQVVAAGGGWVAQPGNLAEVAPTAFVVYLSLAPELAARRLAGAAVRPLLAGADMGRQLVDLLRAREAWYRLADFEVAVDSSSVEAVAAGVATAARHYAGW